MPEELVLLLESLENSAVNVTQIKHWTDHDPVLTKVCRFFHNGWPGSAKWMIVNCGTSQLIIKCLRMIFARLGLPEVMVTDNGTCFTSSEF